MRRAVFYCRRLHIFSLPRLSFAGTTDCPAATPWLRISGISIASGFFFAGLRL
jgi:hypothetical protein